MKFTDIVELAKAGYKPSDIKELYALKEPEDKQEPDGDKKVQKGTEPDDPTDYKALYEAEKKKLEELQKKNSREPQQEPENIEDVIKNIRKSIS